MRRKLVFADNEIVNDLIWRFAGLFGFSCVRPKPLPGPHHSQIQTGCCRNPFSLSLKRFLTNLRLPPGDVKTRL